MFVAPLFPFESFSTGILYYVCYVCNVNDAKCNLKCVFLKRASEIHISMHLKLLRESKRAKKKKEKKNQKNKTAMTTPC